VHPRDPASTDPAPTDPASTQDGRAQPDTPNLDGRLPSGPKAQQSELDRAHRASGSQPVLDLEPLHR
jgi:hypothetical protein